VNIDFDDEETRALLNVLVEAIDADRYPLSPRVRLLQEILAKFGEAGGLPPELAARLADPVLGAGSRCRSRSKGRSWPQNRREIWRMSVIQRRL